VLAYADQEAKRLTAEGLDYLRTVEVYLDGVPVESEVRFGDPAAEILREADAFGADLVAVTTTGRSGLRRVAFGSVAEHVFRKAEVAVMLYHASPHAAR
jgi:nucleotide-binding universal stress UspA family protein